MKRKTYSDIAKKLSKKKAKFELGGDSFDPAAKFTAERMVPRYESKLDNLFEVQEMSKDPIGREMLKYGGKMYGYGGKMYGYGGKMKYFQGGDLNDPTDPPSPGYGPIIDFLISDPVRQGIRSVGNFLGRPSPNALARAQTQRPVTTGTGPGGNLTDYLGSGRDFMRPVGSVAQPSTSAFQTTLTTPSRANVIPQSSGTRRTGTPVPTTPLRVNLDLDTLPMAGARSLPGEISNLTEGIRPDIAGSTRAQMEAQSPGGSVPKRLTGTDIMGAAAPFMDNLANLINPTPRIPAPRFATPARIDTRVNVAPQINEMRRGMRQFGQSVDRSMGQAGQAAAFKGQALGDFFRGVSDIEGQRENMERSLRNQQAQEIARTDMMNQQIASQFDQQQLARTEAERMRRIGLLTNLGEDFMTMRDDKRLRELDDERLDIMQMAFEVGQKDPGVIDILEKLRNVKTRKYGGRLRKKMKK